MPTPNAAFSPRNPFFQTAWDATSLELFIRDPLTYYYAAIEGWTNPTPSAALLFGRAYGECIGYYCQCSLEGHDHESALDLTLQLAIKLAHEGEGNLTLDEVAANSRRREDIRKRDTYRLLRAVVWWCDEYGQDPLYQPIRLPSGRPAIEVHFDLPLGIQIGDEDIRICGHLDGIVENDRGDLLVREWKHTTANALSKYYFDRYRPNVQINHYALAGKLILPSSPVKGVLVEACQTAVGFARFEREQIDRAPPILDEWVGCIAYQVERAAGLAEASAREAKAGRDPALPWHRAQNPVAMRQYGANTFADAAFRLPNLRRNYLESELVRGERWDPTKARSLPEVD